jgi:hypothetical protein
MATNAKIKPRKYRPLSDKLFVSLKHDLGLNGPDQREKGLEMERNVRQALEEFPRYEVVFDAVRPGNQLAALCRLREALSKALDVYREFDERTWSELEAYYEPSTFPLRARKIMRSAFARGLERMLTAVSSLETDAQSEIYCGKRKHSGHAPTKKARDMLIATLAFIFDSFNATPPERAEDRNEYRMDFIENILKSAGVDCPQRTRLREVLADGHGPLGFLDVPALRAAIARAASAP